MSWRSTETLISVWVERHGKRREIWAAKNADELIEASRELFNYTEAGEQIIPAELRRRGLLI